MEDELQLVHLLRAIAVELDLLGAEFAGANRLHPTDLRALIALLDADRAEETATPGRLGEWLGLNSASVTALVDRLERLGHVRRERDSQDRRRVKLVVEERATELGWSFFGPLIGEAVERMRSYDEAERETIRRFLLDMNSLVTDRRYAQRRGS
ncbi:MarR family winged helix-turn-helix transcriptional regulator [Saccharopolyspora phatthalungensis]|uniref:DNA-binding MarR family transcriptional regulator n=1 Tax=Saccharopolyspora phatthalungensis TaxID=664693 RepID=A0A840QHU2_9PSEU|nr:MarR family transcriptional regulator [Saccharopolyspora phatthalungensis]MBB5159767.1 DNA-binding MarR family transcriptional regulator [Saccharopolyspora phatthalungensis]